MKNFRKLVELEHITLCEVAETQRDSDMFSLICDF